MMTLRDRATSMNHDCIKAAKGFCGRPARKLSPEGSCQTLRLGLDIGPSGKFLRRYAAVTVLDADAIGRAERLQPARWQYVDRQRSAMRAGHDGVIEPGQVHPVHGRDTALDGGALRQVGLIDACAAIAFAARRAFAIC